MKKISLLIVMIAATMGVVAQNSVSAWISDSDSFTNIRCAPHGAVAMALPDTCTYMVGLTNPRDGWWQVEWIEAAEEAVEIELAGSTTGKYWIHHSVVGTSTRNYGNQRWCLRATPSKNGKPVYWFTEELVVNPIEVKGDWVKVKRGKHTGWIEDVGLCSNPLTTCP